MIFAPIHYAIVLLVLVLFLPDISSACTCREAPTDAETIVTRREAADVVFLGKVESAEARVRKYQDHDIPEVVASVVVVEAFKGVDVGDEIRLYSEKTSCQAFFRAGDIFLFLASRREADGVLTLNMCGMANYHTVQPHLVDQNARFKEQADHALETLRRVR